MNQNHTISNIAALVKVTPLSVYSPTAKLDEMAEDYVWEKFAASWLSDKARAVNAELDGVYRDLAHRPFEPNSEAHLGFLKKLHGRIDALRGLVDLDLELREVEERMGDNTHPFDF